MVGMLDNYFDPSTYSSGGAGWLAGAQFPGSTDAPPQWSTSQAPPEPSEEAKSANAQDVPEGSLADRLPSILQRIGRGLGTNSNMLMQAGAGFLGAPSFGIGASRALSGAAQGHQQDIRQNVAIGMYNSRFQFLRSIGATPDESIAGTYDDNLYKQLTEKYGVGPSKIENIQSPSTGMTYPTVTSGGRPVSTFDPATMPAGPPAGIAPVRITSPADIARMGLQPGTWVQTPDGRYGRVSGRGFSGGGQ